MKNNKINIADKNPMYGKHGADNSASKPIICIEQNKMYDSIADASRELGIIFQNISKVCKGERNTAGGYHWEFLNNLPSDYIKNSVATVTHTEDTKFGKKKVICIETKTVYKSVHEASKKTGANKTQICKCCKGLRYTANKLHWAYYSEWRNDVSNKKYTREKTHPMSRKIICIETNTIYKTVKDAARCLGLNYQGLVNYLKDGVNIINGNHIIYYDEWLLNPNLDLYNGKTKSRIHKIKCVETGIIYENAKSAGIETGICRIHIASVCKGKAKTSGGYHWKYVD